jgi:hypothetical protein
MNIAVEFFVWAIHHSGNRHTSILQFVIFESKKWTVADPQGCTAQNGCNIFISSLVFSSIFVTYLSGIKCTITSIDEIAIWNIII